MRRSKPTSNTKNSFKTMFVALFYLLFMSICSYAQVTKDKLDYIEKFKFIAIEEMQNNGIPASITLAQGILESSSGKSPLATEAKNHFGIKCHKEWNGKRYYYDDDEKNECFRIYADAEESYRDHSDFLKTRSRYAFLFDLDVEDYKSWAKGLKLAGYATNPKYAELLINCIEDLELYRFDKRRTQEEVMKERKLERAETHAIRQRDGASIEPEAIQPFKESDLSKQSTEFPEYFVFNGVKAVKYAGLTLERISEVYHVSLPLLREYNDLGETEEPRAGENIYLQPKRKIAEADFHTVKPGETMRDVSQIHAIKLFKLLEKNLMFSTEQVQPGQVINLRETRSEKPAVITYGEVVRSRKQTEPEKQVIPNPGVIVQQDVQPSEPLLKPDQHTVQPQETLYSIARKYKIPVSDLIRWNQLTSTDLKINQVLKLVEQP